MAIVKVNVQKGFGLFLHVKLNVSEQIVEKIKKANKVSDVEKKTQLTNTTFFTDNIPKIFHETSFRLRLSILDQLNNASFSEDFESNRYNATLAITRAIKGASKERSSQELGHESLKNIVKFVKVIVLFV